ncbi:GNAT family N-acetyltransferase [Bradyrhizobium sp. WSM3983]|uniref:GNAT family N-acetyltransferase n=1 Tax=Bradyrhizobium sp. WSM3983 TaxID=1038867 RepID=UPI0035295538
MRAISPQRSLPSMAASVASAASRPLCRRRCLHSLGHDAEAVARHGDFVISVADVFQRKGIGLQMMAAMKRHVSDLGYEMIAAETARANAEIRGLAKKAGFADARLGDWQSVHLAKRLSR